MTGEIQLTWIGPTGRVIDLNDPARGWQLIGDVKGVDMPDVQLNSSAVFDQPGEILDSVQLKPRDVDVALAITSDSGPIPIREAARFLAREMSPLRGDGRLRLTLQDGQQRELVARYSRGLDGVARQTDCGEDWQTFVLTFRASDPLWTDAADTVIEARTTGSVPFFPMFSDTADVGPHLASSSVFADLDALNFGDVNAWPVITIAGPARDPIITNVTTGKYIDLSNNGGLLIEAGEWLTIDTRPGQKTILLSDATNLFSRMTDSSELWPLVVGPQTLSVLVGGADSRSLASISYRNRYLIA